MLPAHLLTLAAAAAAARAASVDAAGVSARAPAAHGPVHIPMTRHGMTHIQREHVTEHMRRHLDPKLRRRQDVANDSVDATEADLTLWKRLVTYTIDVDIGTPAQSFSLLVDTGSADMWVFGSNCSGQCAGDGSSFNRDQSTTFSSDGRSLSLKYLIGQATGSYGNDTVTVADQKLSNFEFGIINSLSAMNLSGTGAAGLLGMSWPMYQPAGHSPPFWTAVDDTWKTKEFGLFLGRYNQSLDSINAAPLNDGGQLTLGGVDPDIYVGDIDYIPLVHVETGSSSPLSGNSGAINESAAQVYWSIPMDGLEAFGAEISLGPFDMNKIAIFDSGTTAIYGPPAAVDAFYGQLPSAKYAGSGVYAFKCSEVANANVSFTFGGVPYPVQASDLILEFASKDNHCFGTIMRFDSREASWLFGAAFLANLYTSYRIDPPAVGLAKLSPEYDWKYTGKLNSARTISTSLPTIFTGLLLSVYLAFI